MAACPLCGSRKGKRACPALRSSICSVCCGEKRIVEIACPPDCVYLERGAQNEMQREAADYIQHQEQGKGLRWLRTIEGLGFLLETIERIIAAFPLPSLDDADLLVALESARKTFDAEAKGVIYEDLPAAPSLQALTRELVGGVRYLKESMKEHVEERSRTMQSGERSPLTAWGPAEAAHCLAVLAERCEYHLKRKDEAGSFIAHLRRVYPSSPGEEGSRGASRIVLT